MKTLIVLLFAFNSVMSPNITQETETMKATFTEYVDGIYYFTDADGYSNEFEYINEDALVNYDLTGDEYKGKLFVISYEVDTETDAEGDEISSFTIVDLKMVE